MDVTQIVSPILVFFLGFPLLIRAAEIKIGYRLFFVRNSKRKHSDFTLIKFGTPLNDDYGKCICKLALLKA